MDTTHYKTMVESQLYNHDYYEQLNDDPSKQDSLKYNKFIEEFKDCFTQKEYEYLKKFEVKQRNFYGLPKVHKSKQINDECSKQHSEIVNMQNVTDLKIRPIVAGPSCQTHRLSNMLDILLRPLTKYMYVKINVRDSTYFLNSLLQTINEQSFLTTFDVESLYSNIPHKLGIKAIEFWLDKHPETIPSRF